MIRLAVLDVVCVRGIFVKRGVVDDVWLQEIKRQLQAPGSVVGGRRNKPMIATAAGRRDVLADPAMEDPRLFPRHR